MKQEKFAGEGYQPLTQKIEMHRKKTIGNYKCFNFSTIWHDDKMGKVKKELEIIQKASKEKKDS